MKSKRLVLIGFLLSLVVAGAAFDHVKVFPTGLALVQIKFIPAM